MKNEILFSALVVVLLVSLGYLGYNLLELQKAQTDALAKIGNQEELIRIANEGISNLQQAKESLEAELDLERGNTADLKNQNDRLDKQKEKLEKILNTDTELLKKYSKVFFLSENYEPASLDDLGSEYIYPAGRQVQFLEDTKKYLEDLIDDARDESVDISVTSGYRSFTDQKDLKTNYKITYGAGTANQFSAEQGYSEHQLGTAVDFVTPENSHQLVIGFEATKASRWLTDNAYKYGFIMSYPKGNTYYQYEPWHYRFVGKDLARKIHRDQTNFYSLDQRDIDKYIDDLFD